MGVFVRLDTIKLITNHRRSMGQRQAKQHMQAGVKLYHQRHYAQAINKWRQSLNRLNNAEDRFITLGYLAQALCDQGEYEGMLSYALSQMQLATDQNDSAMKCEAFLNLAKAYERLADFTKALQYGKASLEHPSMDPRTPGYAHLRRHFIAEQELLGQPRPTVPLPLLPLCLSEEETHQNLDMRVSQHFENIFSQYQPRETPPLRLPAAPTVAPCCATSPVSSPSSRRGERIRILAYRRETLRTIF